MQKIEVNSKLVGVGFKGNVVVDNSVFETLNISDKGFAIGQIAKLNATIDFKPDLKYLVNYKIIADKLAKGEDVELELAFNNIEKPEGFDAAVSAYHASVSPLINTIKAMLPKYPWAEKPKSGPVEMTYSEDGSLIYRGGYKFTTTSAKKLWTRASKYWSKLGDGGKRKTRPTSEYINDIPSQGGRYVEIYANRIDIGCQSITRWEVEQIAQHFNWPVPEVD